MSYNLYVPRHTNSHDLWQLFYDEAVAAALLMNEVELYSSEYEELRNYFEIMIGAATMVVRNGKKEFFRRPLAAYKNYV